MATITKNDVKPKDIKESDEEESEVESEMEEESEVEEESEAEENGVEGAEPLEEESEADEEESEAEASEAEASEADEEEQENEFGCPGCNYEWRDGYKTGWRDAMKYIAGRTHKEVPDTLACSYCDIVCKTRKCSGKCGGVVRYCSVDCQKQDWAFGHKNICGK